MIGCLRTHVRKQPIIELYFEFENELKFYNLKARCTLPLFHNGADNMFKNKLLKGMFFFDILTTGKVTNMKLVHFCKGFIFLPFLWLCYFNILI